MIVIRKGVNICQIITRENREFKRNLKQKGYKLTPQRRAIVDMNN